MWWENPTDQVSHCCDLDKQGVCYSGWTQQIDTDDDFMSFFILFYETPLCISSGFCELAASSILSTRACCVTSAEFTIIKTQRQLQSENFIISNLKMNFHHKLGVTNRIPWKIVWTREVFGGWSPRRKNLLPLPPTVKRREGRNNWGSGPSSQGSKDLSLVILYRVRCWNSD